MFWPGDPCRSLCRVAALAALTCVAAIAGAQVAPSPPPQAAQATGEPGPQPSPTFDVYWYVGSPQTGLGLVPFDFRGIPINTTDLRMFGPIGLYPVAGVHMAASDPSYMERHLAKLREDIEAQVPPGFAGYLCFDWESWFPVWELTPNVPSSEPADALDQDFRDDWRDYIRARQPELLAGLSAQEQENALRTSYEQAAKDFFLASLLECKRLRPNAKVGFYLLPLITPWNVWMGDMDTIRRWSDERLQWLWDAADAVFPCVYQSYEIDESIPYRASPSTYNQIEANRRIHPEDNQRVMDAIIDESIRVARGKPVIPLIWSRFSPVDGDCSRARLITRDNLQQMVDTPRNRGCAGLIVWDYYYTPQQRTEFMDFFDRLMGPRLMSVLSSSSRSNVNFRMGVIYRQPDGRVVILRGDAPVDQPESQNGLRLLGDSLPPPTSDPSPARAVEAEPAPPPGESGGVSDDMQAVAPPPKPFLSKNKRIQIVQHGAPRPQKVESAAPQVAPAPAETTLPANKPTQGVGRLTPPIVVRTQPPRAPDRPRVEPVPVPPRKYRPLPPWIFVSGTDLRE